MDSIKEQEQEEEPLAEWPEEELDDQAYQAWLSTQYQDQDDDLEEF